MTEEEVDPYRAVARKLRAAAGDPSRSYVLQLLEDEVGPERARAELPALLASLSRWNAWRFLNPKPGRVSVTVEEQASGYRVVGGRRTRFRTHKSKWFWTYPAIILIILAAQIARLVWIAADEGWWESGFEITYILALLALTFPMMRHKMIEATVDERALHIGVHRIDRSDVRYLSLLAPEESPGSPASAQTDSRALVAATSDGVVEITGWIDRRTAIELCKLLEDELGLATPRLRVEPAEELEDSAESEDEPEELEVDEVPALEKSDVSRPE